MRWRFVRRRKRRRRKSKKISPQARKKVHQYVSERVERYSALTGVEYNRVKITSALRRWGSCTSRGNLNFPWRILMLPPDVIDYIVVHELMHIREMNHSKRFWAHVAAVMPDYRERKKLLQEVK